MPEADSPKPARRPWWRRWLRRLLAFGFWGVVVLAGFGWWAWTYPETVVRYALRQVPEQMRPDIAKVVMNNGTLIFDSLSLKDRVTGQAVVQASEVRWRPDLEGLRHGRLGFLAIVGLQVQVDPSLAQRLGAWWRHRVAQEAAAGGPGVSLGEASIEGAKVKIAASEEWPAVELTLDQRIHGIDFSIPGRPRIDGFQMQLKDVSVDGNRLAMAETSGSLSPEGTLRIHTLRLENGTLAPTPGLLKLGEPKVKTASTQQSQVATTEASLIQSIDLGKVELVNFSLAGSDRSPAWWPKVSGRANVDINGLVYDRTAGLRLGPQTLKLEDFALLPPQGEGHLKARSLSFVLRGLHEAKLQVLNGKWERPEINWTQALEDYLLPKPMVAPSKAADGKDAAPSLVAPAWKVQVDDFQLAEGSLTLERTARVPYAGKAGVHLKLESVEVDAQGVRSGKVQSLRVADVLLAEHPSHSERALDPFIQMSAGRLDLVPDEWNEQRRVRELVLDHSVLTASPENVSWFQAKPPASEAKASEISSPVAEATPWWERMRFDQLVINQGQLHWAQDFPQRVEIHTEVGVGTSEKKHTLSLRGVRIQMPQQAKLPVANFDLIEAKLEYPQMLNGKRLEFLRVQGGEVEVGDALLSLTKEAPPAPGEAQPKPVTPPQPEPLAGWRVQDLAVADTAITLHRIAPGLPPLKFRLGYHAQEVPLAPSELAGNFTKQRIELSQLAIKSPYEPLRNVATLDTIFVDFTLDGLFNQVIDNVEVVSPTLFVGEDLFWYIEYYRKYAAGEITSETKSIALASNDKTANLTAATAPSKTGGGWTADNLQVHAGKLVIAPKGHPLPGIPRPFPFSFTTRLNEGRFAADLVIPSDTYTWEQLKLELENMHGRVQFNLPLKQVDNNLTETFQVDRVRWKELRLEKAHLSVTYDANGIYGKFGGEAYEGYVNGAFNIYLDTNYSWDGWISGVGVRTTEITHKLCPAYFLLDGKVDTTVVAQGNQHELYHCDVTFKNTAPGKFSVVALNDMLKSLPPSMAGYERDIMRIGVETLRDFDYDRVDGQARFYGREGKGFLRLSGPGGSRNIDVNLYDHRWHVPQPESEAETESELVPDSAALHD